MTRSRILSAAFLLTVALCIVGCKQKAGSACKVDHLEMCQDKSSALSCNDGRWELIQCKGSQGCTAISAQQGYCDQSSSVENEPCNMDTDHACTPDKLSMLQCKAHKWQKVGTCKGPKHCELASEKKQVTCDMSLADTNDACDIDNKAGSENYACTTDRGGMLKCTSGKFSLVSTCNGPKSCRLEANKVSCDDSLAKVGDPCDHPTDSYACSADKSEILKCAGHVFKKYETCLGKKKCDVSGTMVACKG